MQTTERESVSPDYLSVCPAVSPVSRSGPVVARRRDVMSLNTPTIIMKLLHTKTNSRRKTICAGNLRQTDRQTVARERLRLVRDRETGNWEFLINYPQLGSPSPCMALFGPDWTKMTKQMREKYFSVRNQISQTRPGLAG